MKLHELNKVQLQECFKLMTADSIGHLKMLCMGISMLIDEFARAYGSAMKKRLPCRINTCCFSDYLAAHRFDGNFCTTAQAPLTVEEGPSGEQHQAYQSITLPFCPKRQTADSWLVLNLRAMSLSGKAKAAWLLRAATLKRQAVIRRWSGNAVSGWLASLNKLLTTVHLSFHIPVVSFYI